MGRCRNSVLLMVLSWLPLQEWRRGKQAHVQSDASCPAAAAVKAATANPHQRAREIKDTTAKEAWEKHCLAHQAFTARSSVIPFPSGPRPLPAYRLDAAMPSSTPMMVASCSWAR